MLLWPGLADGKRGQSAAFAFDPPNSMVAVIAVASGCFLSLKIDWTLKKQPW